jgi:hypothetical protein
MVAGTGPGKTKSFALPLLVQDDSPQKLVLVISPMNTLEAIQVRWSIGCLDLQTRFSEGQKIFFKWVSVPL